MSYEEIIRSADTLKPLIHLNCRAKDAINPDHNLWNNHGTWWCHFTVHHQNRQSERVRVSLKTTNLIDARSRRDQLLAAVS